MKQQKSRLIQPADWILIGLVLAAALLLLTMQSGRAAGRTAVVIQNGEVLRRIDLTDPAPRSYPVSGAYPLTIETENGAVWFAEAACPDQVCVRSGKLSAAGDTAACLPAGVVLRVEGSAGADATTG